jgi:hypothetical protein
MNRIELTAQETSGDTTTLNLIGLAADPVTCTWLVATAISIGAIIGTYYAHVQCKNHGCVQNAPDGFEINQELTGLTVGDMVSIRAEVASLR